MNHLKTFLRTVQKLQVELHKRNLYFITYHRRYYASGSGLEPTLGKYNALLLTLILFEIPYFLEKILKIQIPNMLEIILLSLFLVQQF